MKNKFNVSNSFLKLVIVLIAFILGCSQQSENDNTGLEEGFLNPPSSARPRVWWHWMNGNITKDGIKKDLAWMNRVGIGGFQNFDAAFNTPQVVENRLTYMTPEWKEAFSLTAHLADSLGLEMAIAGSPGWSESGGPWVPISEGMKKMVWSENIIEGGREYSGNLSLPPTNPGAFQNLGSNAMASVSGSEHDAIDNYYVDIAVLAYKIPENDFTLEELETKVTSSGGNFTLEQLTDGDLVNNVFLPSAPAGKKSWIQFEFKQPQTIQSLTMVGGSSARGFGSPMNPEVKRLETSDDGKKYKEVTQITSGGIAQNTITFSPVTAKYFRISIEKLPAPNRPGLSPSVFGDNQSPQTPSGTQIAEIVLHTVPRINHYEEKAGFAVLSNFEKTLTPGTNTSEAINEQEVIDITDKMTSDGTLNWDVPAGKWNVIRFGYSLTGRENHPASPEATGPEVDKLNPDFVKNYFTNYLNQYQDATGGLIGKNGLQYVITDSWEAGCANWTDNMIEEFNKRNSYSLIPWLPVLTGKIIKSSEASEKFLWDFRNTLEEMLAEYHYDELTKILKERGMGRYTESHENGRAFIGDGMEVKRSADIPMSATWTPMEIPGMNPDVVMRRHATDVRESASVAHIYGQNINAAESFTAIGESWAYSPERLKPTADFMLSNGLNRFVIHTSVHQPLDNKIPGLGLGPFGQWFTRHETWAEQAKPWIDYLARSSYMLQQGKFVADIIYVYGQGSNLTLLFGSEQPKIPEGYNFDFLNASAIQNVLSVNNKQIVTNSGMKYNLLVLDESTKYMTLPVLKQIQQLVNEGATIVGAKPINTPSLNDNEEEFMSIVNQLWKNEKGINEIGSGKIYAGYSIEEALNDLQIQPDFQYSGNLAQSDLKYVHRKIGDGDIYWVRTTGKEDQNIVASFRITGMEPEIWNPVTGEISPAYYSMDESKTIVNLKMCPEDALFVVFRKKTTEKSRLLVEVNETQLATLSGSWQVNFQAERGAPQSAEFNELTPWNESEDNGIKYFSGTAAYSKTIDVSEDWITENREIWLDLGDVKNLAEVYLNGEPMGIVWKKPFRVKLNNSIHPGENSLTIKVTNLWVNRLIGDQQPGTKNKITYTTQDFYQANSPLLTSGLLGPVTISSVSLN